jgi:anti-sigma regulatory factor (Ser/Thr protein kinase)
MRTKPKSIRSKIILSLVLPVVALGALWGMAVAASIGEAVALRSAYSLRDQVGRPCDRMVEALQAERSRSLEFLGSTAPRDGAALAAQRAETDTAIAEFRRLSAQYEGRDLTADITRDRIADVIRNLAALTRLRIQIDAGSITRAAALTGYSSIIGSATNVQSAAAASSDPAVERVMTVVVEIRHVGELFSQEDALLTGVTTAGRFDSGELRQLIEIVGALRFQIRTAGASLPEEHRAAYNSMLGNPIFAALRATEERIIQESRVRGPVPITREVWQATFNPAALQLYEFLAQGYEVAVVYAHDAGDRILIRFGLSGVLGLIAIVSSLLLSLRVGGSVVRRLSLLRSAAIDLADRQLPQLVARLRSGAQVEVADDVPRLPLGNDEIADVGAALGEVRRSAIDSAVGEAAMRYGLSKVLVNVARRNQTLIGRQMAALEQIPGVGTTPDHPAVRAGQLAVRMRRNAEHLVILAGSARSGRGLHPEPLADLLRRAAGEVEDAGRVELQTVATAHVPGRAAADIVHLFAELMENATSFSPPDTPVRVSAQRLPDGVCVEIEDRGLGMTPAALEEINRNMAEPPDFDPANSARLGLFVVGQLARQRGIRVGLRPSAFGGITAVVTLPPDLAEVVPSPSPAATEPESRRWAHAG